MKKTSKSQKVVAKTSRNSLKFGKTPKKHSHSSLKLISRAARELSKTKTLKLSAKGKRGPKKGGKTLALDLQTQAKKIDPALMPHVKNFISEIAGPEALQIVETIETIGDTATDESIEQSTKLKLSEVRSILNHLHSYGVVEYNRDKNMANGWFTYTWRINAERAIQNYVLRAKKEHMDLVQKLKTRETTMIFKCRKDCEKQGLGFNAALELSFRCPKCNSALRQEDPEKINRLQQNRLSQIEDLLKLHSSLIAAPTAGPSSETALIKPG